MRNEQKQKLKDYYKKYYAEKKQHDNYSIKVCNV